MSSSSSGRVSQRNESENGGARNIWIGVDVGGTFTDVFTYDSDNGDIGVHKVPSTPSNPAEAILAGIQGVCRKLGINRGDVRQLAHGTTVATNALIQRKGARVCLLTTSGFRDVLEIARQTRPIVYDVHQDIPPPIVPRHRRVEVEERVTTRATVMRALADEEIERVLGVLAAKEWDAVAVCFLFSFAAPEHEKRLAEKLGERFPGKFISVSSEIQPEFREYERFTTATMNAYLQPLMASYLTNLSDRMNEQFPGVEIVISHSNGGLMPLPEATRFPVRTALSGPAAGVVGALDVARPAVRPNVVTFDMGGTSTDVALIEDYVIRESYNATMGGYPIRLPMVDVVSVGAGGGSIAWFDRDGLMKVGPMSAGAAPGPACYGKGGTEATVTDANLVLGRLPPSGLLDGALPLDLERARGAIKLIADRLGISIELAALGILRIVTANMVRAIRTVSVERGYDPRGFSLVAFGGGGPLHARDVASDLEMKEVTVPLYPGILCASGLIAADLTQSFVATLHARLIAKEAGKLDEGVRGLVVRATSWLEHYQVPAESRHIAISLDLAYQGQNYELSLAMPAGPDGAAPTLPPIDRIRADFLALHEKTYGFFSADDPIVVVNVRAKATGRRIPGRAFRIAAVDEGEAEPSVTREVWFTGTGPVPTPIYRRETLGAGTSIAGPAVIEQFDTTILVFPGDTARITHDLTILIEVGS